MPLGTASDDWRYDGAKRQDRLWTPREFPASKLTVWYDFSDTSSLTLDSSSGTSQINDISGNGNHATQGTSGNRPLVRPVGKVNIASRQFAEHQGGSSGMTLNTGLTYSGANGFSAACAAHCTGSANVDFFGGTTGAIELRWTGGGPFAVQIVRRAQAALLSTTATTPAGMMNTVGCDAATNLTSVWLNGSLTTSSTNPAFTVALTTIFEAVGQSYSGGIGEFLFFNSSVLTTRERGLVDGYLAWKWGVLKTRMDVSHPFLTRPPLIGD